MFILYLLKPGITRKHKKSTSVKNKFVHKIVILLFPSSCKRRLFHPVAFFFQPLIESVGCMLLITAIRVGFVVLYRQLKKTFKKYTDLILSIIWTGYLMLWIGRFFNISYVYFLISVFVLGTLNNTVMGTFCNNPIKENVVFLMGKIEIMHR